MRFYNRVRVFTATTGNGTTIALGSAFSDAFLTLAEAGGVVGQETAVVVGEGDDFAIYRVTIGASAGSIDIDSVTVSKIGGTVSTARMNLGGKAMVRFIEAAEDLNDILARIIALEALAASRIGGIGFTLEGTPDNGCVELDGATVRDGATDYPIVAARHPSMVSGDDLILPDFRGLGLRGWDHGARVDPDASSRTANWSGGPTGDNPGSEQADAFQGHWHELYGRDDDRRNAGGGGDAWHGRKDAKASNQMQDGSNQPSVRDIKSDGANGAPRTSSETRMKNVAVLFQMRLI